MLDWRVDSVLTPNPEVVPVDGTREVLTEALGYLSDTLERPFVAVAIEHEAT